MRGLMEGADPDRLAAALKQMGRDAPPAQGMWFMQWVADGLTSQDSAELGGDHPGAGAADLEGGRGTEVRAGAAGRLRLTAPLRVRRQGRNSPASPNSCHR